MVVPKAKTFTELLTTAARTAVARPTIETVSLPEPVVEMKVEPVPEPVPEVKVEPQSVSAPESVAASESEDPVVDDGDVLVCGRRLPGYGAAEGLAAWLTAMKDACPEEFTRTVDFFTV